MQNLQPILSLFQQRSPEIRTYDDWFSEQVREYYENGKNFSDEEKFPLPCVYRWLRGDNLPRPLQISLICTIMANKEFKRVSKECDLGLYDTQIAYDLIYASICSEVMELLKREKK